MHWRVHINWKESQKIVNVQQKAIYIIRFPVIVSATILLIDSTQADIISLYY